MPASAPLIHRPSNTAQDAESEREEDDDGGDQKADDDEDADDEAEPGELRAASPVEDARNIERLLAQKGLSQETRDELTGFREDITEGRLGNFAVAGDDVRRPGTERHSALTGIRPGQNRAVA